jgi:hypothetical protein
LLALPFPKSAGCGRIRDDHHGGRTPLWIYGLAFDFVMDGVIAALETFNSAAKLLLER